MPELSAISSLPASRRTLLGAAALGTAAGAAATAFGASPAFASGDEPEGEPTRLPTLALTLAPIGTRNASYPYFKVRDQSSFQFITVDGVDYVVVAKDGFSKGIIQIFRADTGALHFQADTENWGAHRIAFDGNDTLYFTNGGYLSVVSVREQTYYEVTSFVLPANDPAAMAVDYLGRLWISFHSGAKVVCMDVNSGAKIHEVTPLGTNNTGTPAMSISDDRKTLWVGTGTEDPALFRINVDTPSTVTRTSLPSWLVGTSVQRVLARGRKVFVWHANVQGKTVMSVRDVVTNSWQNGLPVLENASVTTADADGYVYAVHAGQLHRAILANATLVFEAVGAVPGDSGFSTVRSGSTVYLFGHGASQLWAQRVGTTGTAQSKVSYQVVTHNSGTSQLLTVDRNRGVAYFAGEDGVGSAVLSTGASTRSGIGAPVVRPTSMHLSGSTLYIGSEPAPASGTGPVLIAHNTSSGVDNNSSYKVLATVDASYKQGKIDAIAVTTEHIVFGTTPAKGGGGALGTVNRTTGAVTIYPNLVPNRAITGLVASGNTVYGVTSRFVGLGSAVPEAAVAFAADARTGAVLWTREVSGDYTLYGPVLMGGALYVGAREQVLALSPSTGAVSKTLPVMTGSSTSPAASTGRLIQLPATTRLLYTGSYLATMISTATSRAVNLGSYPDHIEPDTSEYLWNGTEGGLEQRKGEAASVVDGRAVPFVSPTVSPFEDITSSTVFYKEMCWMADAGISTGWATSTGKVYRPGWTASRDQMAAFLYRMAGKPDYTPPTTSPYTDVKTTQVFYKEMCWMKARGITTGTAYNPAGAVTRYAMAVWMYRLVGKPAYAAPSTSPFIDVATTHGFYKEIAWLADMGISTGWSTSSGKEFRPDNNVLRDQMAAFLYRLAGVAL